MNGRVVGILLLGMFLMSARIAAAQPVSRAFELRYVSGEPRANGPTDFKGETECLDTDGRIAFLQQYADYAKTFFNDPNLDTDVVPMAEAEARLLTVKAQPLPMVRRRVPLETWRWLGYRDGENESRTASIESWCAEGFDHVDGALVSQRALHVERALPPQAWRFFLQWRVRCPETGRLSVSLGDAAAVTIDGARVTYLSGTNTHGDASVALGAWHLYKLEVDLEEGRFNLVVDGETQADFVPLANAGAAEVAVLRIDATAGVELDDLWGVGYQRTEEPRQPYTIQTYVDETFERKPELRGWETASYDDSAWPTAATPVIHGGERHAGEDLYLRTKVEAPQIGRAVLVIESVGPEADLYVNGQPAGHISSPLPTRVDVTPLVTPGSANTVALRVRHTDTTEPYSSHCPSDVHVGWYAGRMWLDFTAPVAIDDLLIHTETLGNPAYLQPRIPIKNHGDAAFSGTLRITATPWFPAENDSPSGTVEVPVNVAPGGSAIVEQVLAVHDPIPWTSNSPHLYKIAATLISDAGEPVDDEVVTTGIRTVGQGGGTFRINDQPELSTGALLLGYRPPLDQIVVTRAWSPDEWIVRELMQIQRMGGNTARTGFLLGENPRFAEIGDQLGVMFIWSTPAGRWWGDPLEVEFENYPAYMRQVYNHPSIIMWEVANEPTVDTYEQLNAFYSKAYDTLYSVDRSRLICLCTNAKYSKYSGNDAGTIDFEGNPSPYPHVPAWTARMVTRAHHIHVTGYGEPWTTLRQWPGPELDFLNSTDRAYFNTEHEESIGQPNWFFDRGKPSYKIHSYEWDYDEGSIGRKLTSDEWQISQAWQAFSAYESMRRQRVFDVDGFSWCSLHGGANSGTYQKPLMDYYGHAKLAYWAVGMANQDVLAGSADVDVVYGPEDRLCPVVMNCGGPRKVDIKIAIKTMDGVVLEEIVQEGIELPGGRSKVELDPTRPTLAPGVYAIEYTVFDHTG